MSGSWEWQKGGSSSGWKNRKGGNNGHQWRKKSHRNWDKSGKKFRKAKSGGSKRNLLGEGTRHMQVEDQLLLDDMNEQV